jgi:predicted flap endonuclease-1-like 5' DNA nuclease
VAQTSNTPARQPLTDMEGNFAFVIGGGLTLIIMALFLGAANRGAANDNLRIMFVAGLLLLIGGTIAWLFFTRAWTKHDDWSTPLYVGHEHDHAHEETHHEEVHADAHHDETMGAHAVHDDAVRAITGPAAAPESEQADFLKPRIGVDGGYAMLAHTDAENAAHTSPAEAKAPAAPAKPAKTEPVAKEAVDEKSMSASTASVAAAPAPAKPVAEVEPAKAPVAEPAVKEAVDEKSMPASTASVAAAPAPAKPVAEAEPAKAEPAKAKAPVAEPTAEDPNQTMVGAPPAKAEPAKAKAPVAEPTAEDPNQTMVGAPPAKAEPAKAKAPAAEPTAENPAQTVVSAPQAKAKTATESDDLQLIEGIGPKVAGALIESGVTKFAQLAQMSAEEIENIVRGKGVRLVSRATTWPQQARLAAEGKMEELLKYQETLTGGREPGND